MLLVLLSLNSLLSRKMSHRWARKTWRSHFSSLQLCWLNYCWICINHIQNVMWHLILFCLPKDAKVHLFPWQKCKYCRIVWKWQTCRSRKQKCASGSSILKIQAAAVRLLVNKNTWTVINGLMGLHHRFLIPPTWPGCLCFICHFSLTLISWRQIQTQVYVKMFMLQDSDVRFFNKYD